VDWIHVTQNIYQLHYIINTAMNLGYHKEWEEFLDLATRNFSRRTLLQVVPAFVPGSMAVHRPCFRNWKIGESLELHGALTSIADMSSFIFCKNIKSAGDDAQF
jgi:hypothetical protein